MACCPTTLPGVACDAVAKGAVETIDTPEGGPLPVYRVGSGSRCVIVMYDIFGHTAQAFQVCDLLAAAGLNVAMPDFFRGDPWLLTDNIRSPTGRPKDGLAFGEWLSGRTITVDKDLEAAYASLVAGAGGAPEAKVSILGFCWGAGAAMRACSVEGRYVAGGCIHPSMITAEGAAKLCCPWIWIETKDDAKVMEGVREAVEAAGRWGDASVWMKYDHLHHGFAMGRGDWAVAEQAEAVREAVGKMAGFVLARMA